MSHPTLMRVSLVAGFALVSTLSGANVGLAAGNSGAHGGASNDQASASSDHAGGGASNVSSHATQGTLASSAGAANAAHASIQAQLHAAPGSEVGLIKAYADLECQVSTDASLKDQADAAYLHTGAASDPKTRSYIEGLLQDYCDYLAAHPATSP